MSNVRGSMSGVPPDARRVRRAEHGRPMCSDATAALPARTRTLDPGRAADHLDRLYRGALALCGSRERAEDLVQDTYLRVLARPRRLRHDDDLGYLLRALRNTFINQQRAARRRPPPATTREVERFEGTAATGDAPTDAGAGVVFEAIAALPRPYREAVVAIDVVGVSYREAGRALR